ncbi:hypothetical protein AB0J66_06920 [Actinoplanes sp. NPDC049598]
MSKKNSWIRWTITAGSAAAVGCATGVVAGPGPGIMAGIAWANLMNATLPQNMIGSAPENNSIVHDEEIAMDDCEPGAALPEIDRTLLFCAKPVCRMVQVLKEGEDPVPYVWRAYQKLYERYSYPVRCTNPQAVIFMTAEQEALRPEPLSWDVPSDFRIRFGLRVADDERELLEWDHTRSVINKAVRRRLWPEAALYDAITEPVRADHTLKIQRIAQIRGISYSLAVQRIRDVKADLSHTLSH